MRVSRPVDAEFKKNQQQEFELIITDATSGQRRHLRAANISGVESIGFNKSKILYGFSGDLAAQEEILVDQDAQTLIDLMNGEPDSGARAEMQREVFQEMQQEADRKLQSLQRNYEQNSAQEEQDFQRERSDAEEALESTEQYLRETNKDIRSTRRGRFAQWLDQKYQDRQARKANTYGNNDLSFLEDLEDRLYRVVTIGALGRTLEARGKRFESFNKQKQSIQRMDEARKQEKSQKEYRFQQEKQRLVRMHENPSMSLTARDRLAQRIRDYRLEHGDDARFRFIQQPNGKYENVRSDEFKKKQQEQGIDERGIPKRKRSHGRVRSLGRER